MIEKRKFARFDTLFKALCAIGRDIKKAYEVRNISKEGALLILDTPLDHGAELNLSVDVPGDNIPIFVSVRVAWQKESILEPGNKYYQTGVKFTRMNESDRGRFLEFTCSQWLNISEISSR